MLTATWTSPTCLWLTMISGRTRWQQREFSALARSVGLCETDDAALEQLRVQLPSKECSKSYSRLSVGDAAWSGSSRRTRSPCALGSPPHRPQVDSFGSCKNNADAEQTLRDIGHWEQAGTSPTRWNIKVSNRRKASPRLGAQALFPQITTLSYYKFSIAVENSNDLGKRFSVGSAPALH